LHLVSPITLIFEAFDRSISSSLFYYVYRIRFLLTQNWHMDGIGLDHAIFPV